MKAHATQELLGLLGGRALWGTGQEHGSLAQHLLLEPLLHRHPPSDMLFRSCLEAALKLFAIGFHCLPPFFFPCFSWSFDVFGLHFL